MHPVVAIPTCETPQACNSIRENTFCLDDGRNGFSAVDAVAVAVPERRKRRDVLLAQRLLFGCRCRCY